jgi:hypothetical protein
MDMGTQLSYSTILIQTWDSKGNLGQGTGFLYSEPSEKKGFSIINDFLPPWKGELRHLIHARNKDVEPSWPQYQFRCATILAFNGRQS